MIYGLVFSGRGFDLLRKGFCLIFLSFVFDSPKHKTYNNSENNWLDNVVGYGIYKFRVREEFTSYKIK